jgi:hypothetical protein
VKNKRIFRESVESVNILLLSSEYIVITVFMVGNMGKFRTNSEMQHRCFRQWLYVTIYIYFFQNFFHRYTKIRTLKHDVSEEASSFLRSYC